MVMTVGRAIAWGVSGLLGSRRNEEVVAHHDLEHAHWDRVARTWFTHDAEHDLFDARRAVSAPAIRAAGPAARRATTPTPHRRPPRRRSVTGRVNRVQPLDSRRQAVEAER